MTSDAHKTVERWVAELPEGCTSERVREGFWYVRLPGTARRWIPVEIEVDRRTVRVWSIVIVPPEENVEDVYRLLLRHNARPSGVAFALDRNDLVRLVGRIRIEDLTVGELDAVVGRILELTEITFRSILRLGFASRLKKSRP